MPEIPDAASCPPTDLPYGEKPPPRGISSARAGTGARSKSDNLVVWSTTPRPGSANIIGDSKKVGFRDGDFPLIQSFMLLSLLAVPPSTEPVGLKAEAQFLNRADLPDDIDFQLLSLGFAVVRLKLENGSDAEWKIATEDVEVRDPKGKRLKPASLDEITPKVMKHGRTSKRFAGAGAEVGTRRQYPGYHPGGYPGGPPGTGAGYPGVYQPPVPGNSGPGTVAVGRAQQIREILQSHKLEDVTLAPGESLEALIYLKSDKPASKLRGGSVHIPPLAAIPAQ